MVWAKKVHPVERYIRMSIIVRYNSSDKNKIYLPHVEKKNFDNKKDGHFEMSARYMFTRFMRITFQRIIPINCILRQLGEKRAASTFKLLYS